MLRLHVFLVLACAFASALHLPVVSTQCRSSPPVCSAAKKKNSKSKGKSGGAKATSKGFGASPPPAPPPLAPSPSKGPAVSSELVAVDLGGGKKVAVMLPARNDEPTDGELNLSNANLEQYSHLYGAGDVVWPASIALARMLAHVPTLTAGKRVLELGCGLGAAGLAAASAGAASVVLSDRDASVLAMASEAAEANGVSASVTTASLDFGDDEAGIRKAVGEEPYDVIIGADILYDAGAAARVAALLDKLLPPASAGAAAGGEGDGGEVAPAARVLLADPEQRLHRERFTAECAKLGLSAVDDVLPGPEAVRLVGVVRE